MMSKIIPLTQGKEAIVDDEDYEWLSQWKWFISKRKYASRHFGDKLMYMHRMIMNTPSGMETDHINGNELDNRRENLRICTRKENARNIKYNSNNTSGYKGVVWDKRNKKWRAQISYDKINKTLGRFENILDAVLAYDTAAKELFGAFAKTNF